jgi:hypothetical protein
VRVVFLFGCAALSMGCSFIFAQNPPDDHEQLTYFDCPSTRAAPATDVGYAVISGLFTVATTIDDPDTLEDESSPSGTRVFGALTAVAAASAVYGFIVTAKCEDAKDQLGERVLRSTAQRLALEQTGGSKTSGAVACARDTDCKGDRICAIGVCVEPPSAPKAAPEPAPSEPPSGTTAPAEPALTAPPEPELPPLQPGSKP